MNELSNVQLSLEMILTRFRVVYFTLNYETPLSEKEQKWKDFTLDTTSVKPGKLRYVQGDDHDNFLESRLLPFLNEQLIGKKFIENQRGKNIQIGHVGYLKSVKEYDIYDKSLTFWASMINIPWLK